MTDENIGKSFNRLTVISDYRQNGVTFYKCVCVCGNEKGVRAYLVKSGKTKSCGVSNARDLCQNNDNSWYGQQP